MNVEVSFTDRPIEESGLPLVSGAGAMVEFRGVVRGLENGAPISALIYDLYKPMAAKVIREIVTEIGLAHPCLRVEVIHRHGTIPVGETAIYLRVDSRHRGEGFRMLEEFMNRLKKDVPIWKTGSVPC
jgi:molybdopterin synthase catalytic subunit